MHKRIYIVRVESLQEEKKKKEEEKDPKKWKANEIYSSDSRNWLNQVHIYKISEYAEQQIHAQTTTLT